MTLLDVQTPQQKGRIRSMTLHHTALPSLGGQKKRGTSQLVRNVMQNKLRDNRLLQGEDSIQEQSHEESDFDNASLSDDLNLNNLNSQPVATKSPTV